MARKTIKNEKSIRIELVREGAKIPAKSNEGSIGFDIYCPEDTLVPRGRSVIKAGFCIELPVGIEGKVEPRSGFSSKGFEGCAVIRKNANSFESINDFTWNADKKSRFDCDVIDGKVDPYYDDEVGVIVKNNDAPFVCPKGTRIAQLTLYNVDNELSLVQVKEINHQKSRGGGFGHSGTM